MRVFSVHEVCEIDVLGDVMLDVGLDILAGVALGVGVDMCGCWFR